MCGFSVKVQRKIYTSKSVNIYFPQKMIKFSSRRALEIRMNLNSQSYSGNSAPLLFPVIRPLGNSVSSTKLVY